MLDRLPIELAHAIAARLGDDDPCTRESAYLASPRLLPVVDVALEVPAEADAASLAASRWLRSPAASIRGLETRAVLRIHPRSVGEGPTDPEAARAALQALAASGRRVVRLALVSTSSAATGPPSSSSVGARAFFEDAAALLGPSLREIVVRDVRLALVKALAQTTTAPPPPARLVLDSLELDGATAAAALPSDDDDDDDKSSDGGNGAGLLEELVEAAICPAVRATVRLVVRLRPQRHPLPGTNEQRLRLQQQQQERQAQALAAACAALSRDALGRPVLREVEVLGLEGAPAAALEGTRRCIVAALGGEEEHGGATLRLLRLGLGGAAGAAANANANTTAATASIVEAQWRGPNPLFPSSLSVHARVADPGAFAGALRAAAEEAAMMATGGRAPTSSSLLLLPAVESLTLLLAPAALMLLEDGGASRLAVLLRSMPRLRRLRLAIMATSSSAPGGTLLLERALRAVAAADPPSLQTLEVCGGLASVRARSAGEALAPLGGRLGRSLRVLKVAAAFVVVAADAARAPPFPPIAAALPSLRWLSLNNLAVGSTTTSSAAASLLPVLDAADLSRGLERLDARGWALTAEGEEEEEATTTTTPALCRLSLRECSFSPSTAARISPAATDVVLCGWRALERDADALARAWPRLRALTLGGNGNGSAPPLALPALVAAAARRCLGLRELRLQGLAELDAAALAQALLPAAATLRTLDVEARANAPTTTTTRDGRDGENDDEDAPAAPDAAAVARAALTLPALRRLRVKAPGWRLDARKALEAAIARSWMSVEAVCAPSPLLLRASMAT